MSQVNGTHAKDIAFYYLDHTLSDKRYTKMQIVKCIAVAKSLMKDGYTKQEILDTIDYCINKGIRFYSLGFISACIGETLPKLKEEQRINAEKQRLADLAKAKQSEVTRHDESTERNRDKATRLGVQSRLREKHSFDLFETS